MKVFLLLLVCAVWGCSGQVAEQASLDGIVVSVDADPAVTVDACVENAHTTFLCNVAHLPSTWSTVGACNGTPKHMHVESGTLLVREQGRIGCVESESERGERIMCCP